MKRRSLLTSLLSHHKLRIRISSIAVPTAQRNQPPTNRRSFLSPSTAMVDHSTLVKPPPIDPSKSGIENVLELTELSAIGPVRIFYSSHAQFQLTHPTGHVHQHTTPLAPTRRTRNLRRRRNSTMPLSSPANRPLELRSTQHALLLRARRRQRNTSHVLRRARPRREIIRNTHCAGKAEREMHIHNHDVFRAGEERREEDDKPCGTVAGGVGSA